MIKYVVIVLIIFFVIYIIASFNDMIYAKKRVERSHSLIDVYLKKRFDLIPNLVEVAKGYAKHEEQTLEKVALLRNSFNNEAREELNGYYQNLVATIEKYPELKASDLFLELQKKLSKIESELQASRRIYINDITRYNTKLEAFPSMIFGKILGYKKEDMPKYITEDITIDFSK